MSTAFDLATAPPRQGTRVALVAAIAGSAGAGLIHAAAIRSHQGDPALAWMFAAAAVLQLTWAVAAMRRPVPRVLAAGILLNAGALLVWTLSRTTGISFVGSLADPEVVGAQDLGAALFAAASVAGAVGMLARPVPRRLLTPAWTGALAAFALVAAMPALVAGHTHDHAGHTQVELAGAVDGGVGGHDHGAAAAGDAATATTHGHTTDTTAGHEGHTTDTTAGHAAHTTDTTAGHAGHTTDTTAGHEGHTTETTVGHEGHATTTTRGGPPPPTGPIISLDDPRVTPAQRAIAVKLISDVRGALSAFPNVAAVEAAGYVSIGDGGADGFEHYVKWGYLTDGREMDPSRIESIVVKKSTTGPKQIVSGMYILNLGKTMANTPELAGELTSWHLHDNLCFEGTALVAIAVDGVCAHGALVITPPMLHVWLIDRPCGPFAGLEADGEICAPHHH